MTHETQPSLKYSYREYACFPNDGFRHEIIDGEHYMSPAPSTNHQRVSRKIQFQLYDQIELKKLGEVFNAPTDVELAMHDIVQPDLVVVLESQTHIITPKKIKGIPNLVIEILSESNPQHDLILKFEMYQRSGVPEYWIVDPDEQTVQQYFFVDGRYIDAGKYHDRIASKTIVGVAVDLTDVWH